jgi:hypothetical protein
VIAGMGRVADEADRETVGIVRALRVRQIAETRQTVGEEQLR